jgi:branched-chain amino acid transport system substrate-binding protein
MRNAIMNGMRRFIVCLLLATSCGRLHETNRRPVIGLVVGVTGPIAAYGEADRRGATLAAEEHNATLAIEDDQGRPEQSANAVERLITAEGVVAIVGCDTSGETLAASPICEREHVAIISPTASAPIVTKGKHYTFRVCALDDFEAVAAARLARERLHANRVAIVRDTKNDYSVGMAATFTNAFTSAGGTISGTFDYAEGDSDFRPQLTAAGATKPDALFVPGYYGEIAQIASQSHDLTMTAPIICGSGCDSPKLVEIGGQAVEGTWFVSGVRSASPRFVAKFRQRYGTDPDAANAQSYDAVSIILDAIQRAGNDRVRIRDAIAATHNFPGASGSITIGPDGNARKPLGVFHVVGGRYVQEGVVKPRS